MNSSLSIAASGLRAQATRLRNSAHNVANLLTDGFVPQRVDLQTRPGGGVRAVVSSAQQPSPPRADAAINSPVLSRPGGSQVPSAHSGADPVFEAITQISASRAYEANLAVLRSEQSRADMLLAVKPL